MHDVDSDLRYAQLILAALRSRHYSKAHELVDAAKVRLKAEDLKIGPGTYVDAVLTTTSATILERAGVVQVRDLRVVRLSDLTKQDNVGEQRVENIRAELRELGIKYRD